MLLNACYAEIMQNYKVLKRKVFSSYLAITIESRKTIILFWLFIVYLATVLYAIIIKLVGKALYVDHVKFMKP